MNRGWGTPRLVAEELGVAGASQFHSVEEYKWEDVY